MATVLERIAPKARKFEAGTVHWFNECVERGKREVFSETATVTPGLANVILGSNPNNRRIRPAKLWQFVVDMRTGNWAFNGEPVIIAKTGELNDGQHRLSAIIDANTSIPLLFVFGIDRDARLTIDQGAARSAADYLGMEGVENATAVASIARLVIAFERSGEKSLSDSNKVTNAEVRARAERDEKLHASAHFTAQHSKLTKNFAAPAIIGFCHYVLTSESATDAAIYMTQICTGEGLKKTDPAFVVRDRLLNLGRNREQKIEVILRGWNAYRSGRPTKLVKALGSLPALI